MHAFLGRRPIGFSESKLSLAQRQITRTSLEGAAAAFEGWERPTGRRKFVITLPTSLRKVRTAGS